MGESRNWRDRSDRTGIIQPIVVRKRDSGYEIVAGERRWRASQRAGLLKVPIVVRDIPDDRLLAAALIENLQREDLNPMEEAHAYRRLADEFHLTQEQIADAVGKDRSSVANVTRLLRLPLEIRDNVAAGAIAMGHARALLSLPDETAQLRLGREVVSKQLSVRETEVLVKKALTSPSTRETTQKDVHTRAAEDRLRFALGTAVRIVRKRKGGKIEVDFTSEEELQRLYEQIVGKGMNWFTRFKVHGSGFTVNEKDSPITLPARVERASSRLASSPRSWVICPCRTTHGS